MKIGIYNLDFDTKDYGGGVAVCAALNPSNAFDILRHNGKLNSNPDQYILINATLVTECSVYQYPRLLTEKLTESKWAKGDPGSNTYSILVYKKSDSKPDTPVGGDYDNPIPEGWSNAIPEGVEILWTAARLYTNDKTRPQTDWSEPVMLTGRNQIIIRYTTYTQDMGNPDSDPEKWTVQPSPASEYSAIKIENNSTWSDWNIYKIKGGKGDPGMSAYESAQYGGYEGSVNKFYTDLADISTVPGFISKVNQLEIDVDNMTALTMSSYLGIFPNAGELHAYYNLQTDHGSCWGLVGEDLTALKLHSILGGSITWKEWDKVYDFTDFTQIKAALGGMKLRHLTEAEYNKLVEDEAVDENTIYFCVED